MEKELLTLTSILTLLCPGLVFVFTHATISQGRAPGVNKDNIAAYIAVSALYTVTASALNFVPNPLFKRDLLISDTSLVDRIDIIIFAIISPVACGLIYAAIKQRKIFYRVAKLMGLEPIYPAPTAWETMIDRILVGDFIVVKLKDGRTVAGNLDKFANFSTKEDCYDMLLSETDPGPEQPDNVVRATWIASGEISTLEIVSERFTAEISGPKLFFRPMPGESYDG